MKEELEYQEIDLLQMINVLWRNCIKIIAVGVIAGLVSFGGTYFLVTPLYQSDVMIYVNNAALSLGNTEISISPSELTAAQSLAQTYIVILNTRSTLEEIIDEAELDCTYEELKSMITANTVDGTEIFKVTVTNPEPKQSEMIANTILKVLPERISEIVKGSDICTVDFARIAVKQSSPNYMKNTALGILLGCFAAAAYFIIRNLMDTQIHSVDYLIQKYPDIPVLASIPDIGEELKAIEGEFKKNNKKNRRH